MAETLRVPTSIGDDQWRCYGAARRRALVENDELHGGTSFDLNEKCRIEKYFQLAERVAAQFRVLCNSQESSLEDSYVMGHRIMMFLTYALPKHPQYSNSHVAHLRTKSCHDMVWIREKMNEIALAIDEEQLNIYITNDFDPMPDDDSSTSSDVSELDDFQFFVPDDQWNQVFGQENEIVTRKEQETWEDFAGWGFTNAPSGVETDTSSSDLSSSREASVSEPKDEPDSFHTAATSTTKTGESVLAHQPASEDPELQLYNDADPEIELSSDDESESDEENGDTANQAESAQQRSRPPLHDPFHPALGTNFLKKIAEEKVMYETDSEAVDSWAEDGESGFLSTSSGGRLTCDPARIAFREIMNNLPRTYTPPPPPRNSPAGEDGLQLYTKSENFGERDHWAAFDFASVRRQVPSS